MTCSQTITAEGLRLVGDPVDVVTGALIDVAGDLSLPGPLPIVWQRHYDSSRRATAGPLGHGRTHSYSHTLRPVVDGLLYTRPDGGGVLFRYQRDGQPAAQALGHGLEHIGAVHRVREPAGDVREFLLVGTDRPATLQRLLRDGHALELRHDACGRLIGIDDPGDGRSVELTYEREQITELRLLRPGNPPLPLVRYQYSDVGDLIGAVDRYGARQSFVHDDQHRLLVATDRRGYRFEYTHDDLGRCTRARGQDGVQEVRLRYLPEARTTAVTRADGGEWLYFHDDDGSITKIVDPYGGARSFTYDEYGRIASETEAGGDTRAAIYGPDGRLSGWRTAAGGLRPPGSPSGPVPHRQPGHPCGWELGDLADRVTAAAPIASPGIAPIFLHGASIFSPLFAERDPRLESNCRRDELGLLLEERSAAAAHPRRWTYNENGWVRRHVDHDGGRHEFTYASWNHRVGATDPLGRSIQYEYTPTEQISAVTDPAGNLHTYRYDLRGELTEVHHSGALVETYTHDRAGRLTAKHDARGQLLLSYEYGPDGLRSLRRLADGEEHRYVHDPNGRFLRITDGEHALEFAYAANGKRRLDLRDGRGVAHRFVGDQLAATTVLGRFTTRYHRIDDRTLEIVDPLGNVHTLETASDGAVFRQLACGSTEISQYDSLGRCLGKHLYGADPAAPVWRRTFQYSAEGDLLAVNDSECGRTSYQHDAAHQLAGETTPAGAHRPYRHDVAGNLVEAPHLRGVTVGPGNKLQTANGADLTHDHRNNLATWVSRDVGDPAYAHRELRFHHDALDRLRRIDGLTGPDGAAAPWSAEYDALGRRTRKAFNNTTTEYFWDTDRLAAELQADGRLRIYVYVDDFALTPWLCIDYSGLDADPTSGALHYLLHDQRGAPVAALDAAGERVWSATLAPHGVAETHGPLALTLRFPGHFHDPETGLHYNRFRYYAPELGRYIEEDPAGTGGGINLYAYTSDPLTQVDLRGLKPCTNCDNDKHEHEDGEEQKDPRDSSPPRLPQTGGTWLDANGKPGERGNSFWHPDPNTARGREVLKATGGRPVQFKNGFPDFSPFAKVKPVTIDMVPDHRKDFRAAGEKSGVGHPPPKGYTWHHHEDCKTMILVPKAINNGVPHTGGHSIKKKRQAK
jgi:RHS repeat-associated protein